MPLRQHEQLGLCELLIVAGNDSTANALSLGMLRLVERPDIAESFNWLSSGEPWHFFVSPESIVGKRSE